MEPGHPRGINDECNDILRYMHTYIYKLSTSNMVSDDIDELLSFLDKYSKENPEIVSKLCRELEIAKGESISDFSRKKLNLIYNSARDISSLEKSLGSIENDSILGIITKQQIEILEKFIDVLLFEEKLSMGKIEKLERKINSNTHRIREIQKNRTF